MPSHSQKAFWPWSLRSSDRHELEGALHDSDSATSALPGSFSARRSANVTALAALSRSEAKTTLMVGRDCNSNVPPKNVLQAVMCFIMLSPYSAYFIVSCMLSSV
ncbi:hypothetical protein FKP32DRAFT_1586813 [Trametes sanguinea]|nr:hypothetical protein FKP32DRAFT_1586813 [Trametes sanguinea]